MKLNDIKNNLKKDLDISNSFKKQNITVTKKLGKKNINDLTNKLSDINIGSNEKIKVFKSRTKNFDSLVGYNFLTKVGIKKLKDPINLLYLSKIKVYFKHKKQKKNFFSSIFYFFNTYIKPFLFNKFLPLFILLFILVSFSLLYLDKIYIEKKVRASYEKLISIKNNPKDIAFIKKQVNDSKFDFSLTSFLFKPFLLINKQEIRNANYIINGGKELTYSIDKALLIYDKILLFIKEKKIDNIELSGLLSNLEIELKDIQHGLEKTVYNYKNIKNLGIPEIESKILKYTKTLESSIYYIKEINDNLDLVLEILGHNSAKNYLIVFQNSDEIRPMGGFMGSMGVLNIYKGKVNSFKKRDIYAYEWDLKSADYDRYDAPEGLNKITEKLGLRDSNYFVQAKDSSDTINFFMDKLGYNIDGIIYINQNIILDFLDETGEIDFKKIGEKVNSSNFSEIISILVESKIFKVGTLGTPKKILFDFIEEFVYVLKEEGNYYNYVKILLDSIEKRDLVFYHFSDKENKFINKFGLNSYIDFSETLDFSYPVFTSISGNKSDRYITKVFSKDLTFNEDCSIDTNLNIKLKHTFSNNDEKRINGFFDKYGIIDDNLINIQGLGDNNQYIRLLLPKDVIVRKNPNIKVKYFETKTLVDFYMKTKRGEVKDIDVKYSLINRDCLDYDFRLIKQPGIRDYKFLLNIDSSEIVNEENVKKDFYFKYK